MYTPSFVRKMAKKFEEIAGSTSYEANFKHCNWWLEMPTCFDDLAQDSPHDSQAPNNDSCAMYPMAEETSPLDVDTAEVASELSEKNSEKEHFLSRIDRCLSFRTKKSLEQIETADSDLDESKPVLDSESHEEIPDSYRISSGSEEANNWHTAVTPTISRSESSRLSDSSSFSMSSITSGQITNTVEELLFNEETYIRSLNHGINGYMKNFNRKDMPTVLRGQMYRVFGNVHRIKDFHEKIFFPALQQCNMDIVKICNTFCDYVEKDYFYIYILYAINHQNSEKLCIANRDYFKQIQNEIEDKLGINSFLVQPIQRLPKYKLLLRQLFTELGKRFSVHDDSIKNELGACCLAEKRIQRLLDTLNGSMNINDIIGCEVHALCQGKFILVDRFDICEKSDLRRRYKGKVFLFEKCIIYTEISTKNKLLYRGHFRHATLGFTFEDQRNYFRLYNERKGNQEVEFISDAATVQLWIQMLNQTMSVIVQREKKRIKTTGRYSTKNELTPLQVLLFNTTPGLRELAPTTIQREGTDSSSGESQRNSNEDTASIQSGRSLDSQLTKRTTWYFTEFDSEERRLIERIYNSEKFYIQLLKNAISTYLTDLPDDLRTNLKPYLKAINRIAKFHTEIFYPKLLQCDMKTITICDLIKTCLDSLEFNVYFKYSAFVHEALQLIQNLNSENNKNQESDDSSIKIESLLLMPINHIALYAQILEDLLNEYKARDFLAVDFKRIAAVEIEMKKLQKFVTENYALNSMKGSTCVARKFGIITYSDEISIDFTKCRIMILEMGLVCVRTRLSTKTKKEKFIDQLFSIPILNIELHENDAYPRKMKIIADNANHVNYTISFATTRKKRQFMDAIRTQRNAPSQT